MMQINIHEAKSQFSQLIERVETGEQIIITIEEVPKAILSKYHEKNTVTQNSLLDRYTGQIEISQDFDGEDSEINQLFGI